MGQRIHRGGRRGRTYCWARLRLRCIVERRLSSANGRAQQAPSDAREGDVAKETVELFVVPDGELQMARDDPARVRERLVDEQRADRKRSATDLIFLLSRAAFPASSRTSSSEGTDVSLPILDRQLDRRTGDEVLQLRT